MPSPWTLRVEQYLAEGLPVSGGKTDKKAQAQGQKVSDAGLANQSAAMGQQGAFTGDVRNALRKYLTGDVGYSPDQLATLNSQFLNQNNQQFNQAGMGVRNALLSRGVGGGDQPIGGNYVRGIASLEGLKGATTAAGLQDIRLQNIQQALANKFNTANIFAGIGGQYGNQAVGFGNQAVGGADVMARAWHPGFMDSFANSLGSGLGGGIGQGLTGGLGKLIYGSGGGTPKSA